MCLCESCFFQTEDGIGAFGLSRGLGDVYKSGSVYGLTCGIAIASDRSCRRVSAGSLGAVPVESQRLISRSAKITTTRSPFERSNVSEASPPPGQTTGTFTRGVNE